MKEELQLSKHNYSQYSKHPNKNGAVNPSYVPPATTPKAKEEFVEAVIDPVIEPVAAEPAVEPVIDLVEETVSTVTLPKTVTGTVVDCTKLNVRAEPSITADVVCVLDVMSEVEIDVAKSTNEWFKICTAIGAEGYCMRQFINATL